VNRIKIFRSCSLFKETLLLCFNSDDTAIRLWVGQPKNRGSIRGTGKQFSLLIAFRPALGLNHPSTEWVLRVVSPGVKGLGHESNHSPPFTAKIKNSGVVTPLLHTFSWRGTYMIKHTLNMNIFYFHDNTLHCFCWDDSIVRFFHWLHQTPNKSSSQTMSERDECL
jgi:hypothetical protein